MPTHRARQNVTVSGFRTAIALRAEIERCIKSHKDFIAVSSDKPELADSQLRVLTSLEKVLAEHEEVVRLCEARVRQYTRFTEPTNLPASRRRHSGKSGN